MKKNGSQSSPYKKLIRWCLLLLLLLPMTVGFRAFPGANRWSISRADVTLWVRSCRKLTFASASFPEGDPLAGILPTYDLAMQSIFDDYNNIGGSFLRLAAYPADPANPPPPNVGDTAFTPALAQHRTIDLCFTDQTVTSGHAKPEWNHDGFISGCDVRLNDNLDKAEEFISVLTHELGHCLGLDHPQETDDAIMSYFSHSARLQIDDKMGMTYLYPQEEAFGRERATYGLSCTPR